MSRTTAEWRFPLPCPNCLKMEGVPVRVAKKANASADVWVRCCRCAHEWRIWAKIPPVILKPKPDRRRPDKGDASA